MLCGESQVAYEWLIHGCCGWNIAATVLEGLSGALETRRCAKVNLCENIARTQFQKDSWGDGIADMASCGITMCQWIAGIHPRIGKFPQICRGPEIIEIWVTALKPSQLCKACCHFIKPASLIHSTFGAESGWGAACGVFLGLYSLSFGGRWSTTVARVFRSPSTVVATSIAAARGRLVAGEQRGVEDQHGIEKAAHGLGSISQATHKTLDKIYQDLYYDSLCNYMWKY